MPVDVLDDSDVVAHPVGIAPEIDSDAAVHPVDIAPEIDFDVAVSHVDITPEIDSDVAIRPLDITQRSIPMSLSVLWSFPERSMTRNSWLR